jgi:hypothetical protein
MQAVCKSDSGDTSDYTVIFCCCIIPACPLIILKQLMYF